MLKPFLYVGHENFCRYLLFRPKNLFVHISKAQISTNSAIHKSLRRSQKRGNNGGETQLRRRRGENDGSSRDVPYSYKRSQRPNHQEGLTAEDMDQRGRINERYQTLKKARNIERSKPPRLRTLAENSVSEGLSSAETIRKTQARYDYSPKPGGNRAMRRAAKFEHNSESSSKPVVGASNHRAAAHQASSMNRELEALEHGTLDEVEGSDEFSLPRDLWDDKRSALQSSRRPFTMGRHPLEVGRTSRGPAFLGSRRRTFEADADELTPNDESQIPISLPYTTSASEFLYGTSAVFAALESPRRKLYKLYIYSGDNREARDQDRQIRELALKRDVVVERVKGDWLRVMDKMSSGRPHNGYILEASPLPKLPVIGFQRVVRPRGPFHVVLDHQSREDEEINGKDTLIQYDPFFPRYPFVLLLDGILDPGNLGAILRTAFFLGVDVVAIANRSSVSVSAVALKASSGASENLPLVSVNEPENFLDCCKKNGWKIYAAAAANAEKQSRSRAHVTTSALGSPTQEHACIVVLGSEGEGLRWSVRSKASCSVSIEGPRQGQGRVDSLNVSVAAGLLCEAFLRNPNNTPTGKSNVNTNHKDSMAKRLF